MTLFKQKAHIIGTFCPSLLLGGFLGMRFVCQPQVLLLLGTDSHLEDTGSREVSQHPYTPHYSVHFVPTCVSVHMCIYTHMQRPESASGVLHFLF